MFGLAARDQFLGGAAHRVELLRGRLQRKPAALEIGFEGVQAILQGHCALRWLSRSRRVRGEIGLFADGGVYRAGRDHLFVQQMSDRLQELAVFVRAAESGSFSRAARELGLSQPSVSRIVSDLEARLGVTLLLRTTRRITVTDAGALFLERARGLLHELEEAEDAARGVDSLRGLIRIAMPVLYGIREIVPRMPDFMKAHPLLRVEFVVADELQNLIAEGADIAIRLGKLSDSSFRRAQTNHHAAPGRRGACLSESTRHAQNAGRSFGA